MEQFRHHPKYPSYLVGNLGTVISLRKSKPKIMHFARNKNGYCILTISEIGKKPRSEYVHALVAECWVDGYFDGAEVDHINTDKTDNRACNLRWVTHEENMNNALTVDYRRAIGVSDALGISRMRAVRCVNDGKEFESIKDAAEYYGINRDYIRDNLARKYKHQRLGLIFEYTKKENATQTEFEPLEGITE